MQPQAHNPAPSAPAPSARQESAFRTARPNAFETLFLPAPALEVPAATPEAANDTGAARRPNMLEKRRRRRARMMAR